MLFSLSDYWWLFVFRGVLGLLFGVASLVYTGVDLEILLYFFAAFILVEGSFLVVAALEFRKKQRAWWIYFVLGTMGFVLGSLALFSFEASIEQLLLLAGCWSVVIGGLSMYAAIHLRKELPEEWSLFVAGAGAMVFGCVFIFQPAISDLSMIWLIGFYTTMLGVMFILTGLRVNTAAIKTAKELTNVLR